MLDARLDTRRFALEACGHAGYAPEGQDIVCAGASMLTATLARALGGVDGYSYEDDGHRVRIACTPSLGQVERVKHVFDVIDCGFGLLCNSYPNHVRYTKI